MEPTYSFTLPSIEDDTRLDCRLYHPPELLVSLSLACCIRGAVVAHPYAPLGGCYDDPVVLAVTACLVREGYIVSTFNFRGATGAQGKTSWSARGEREDYTTIAGFLAHYLRGLSTHVSALDDSAASSTASQHSRTGTRTLDIILAGYSYGSLIVSRLQPLPSILHHFQMAPIGSSAAEVMLRARRLASETAAFETDSNDSTHGRANTTTPSPPLLSGRARALSSTVKLGGEETQSSERRLSSKGSRELRDLVKKRAEVPRRLKMHIRRHSSSQSQDSGVERRSNILQHAPEEHAFEVKVRYLLISPLLPPLAHALAPPAQMASLFGRTNVKDISSGFGSLEHKSLAIWGSDDGFTSSKKLGDWIEKMRLVSSDTIKGVTVDGAGHFWREPRVLKQLLEHIITWQKPHDG